MNFRFFLLYLLLSTIFLGCGNYDGVRLQFFSDEEFLLETEPIDHVFLTGSDRIVFPLAESDGKALAKVSSKEAGNQISVKASGFQVGTVVAIPQDEVSYLELRAESFEDLAQFLMNKNVNLHFSGRENDEEPGLFDLFND